MTMKVLVLIVLQTPKIKNVLVSILFLDAPNATEVYHIVNYVILLYLFWRAMEVHAYRIVP